MHEAGGSAARTSALYIDGNSWVTKGFRAACDRFGDRVAVAHYGPDAAGARVVDQLTYAALAARAEAVGHRLRAYGIVPGDAVGVLTPAGPDMAVAHVAVLLVGATCVPMDPAVGVDRIERIVEDAGVGVVLVEPGTAERAPSGRPRIDVRAVEPAPTGQAVEASAPRDPAYVIYTSGSSGKPKGVRLGHRALAESTRARLTVYDSPGPQLLLSSPAFDIWVGALWWALVGGETLVTVPATHNADVHWIPRLIERAGVARFMCMPALYRLVLDGSPPERFAGVRMVITGAERVPPDLLTLHERRMPGVPLFNEYGLTETAVWNTVHRCDPAVDRAVVPIGRPVPGSRVWVVDGSGVPVPAGEVGEIVIGGPCLADGYQGQPEETARLFVLGPEGERVYRTGDRARVRPDGALEFIGRLDRQVKIRGQRVELGEIEATLATHDDVQRCAIALRGGAGRPRRLQAYVEPRPVPDGPRRAEARAERVRRWSMIDRAVHGELGTAEDPTFDISGWNDSFDGTPIPAEQMRRWVEASVDLVAAQRPRRILELGCGSGLLLFRLAPHCIRYVGCDVAAHVVEGLRASLAAQGRWASSVEVMVAGADEAPARAAGDFDTVVINSVTQHFPDVYYLVDVLDAAVARITGAGAVVVGDVRSRRRLNAFHTAVELHRARPDASADAVASRIARKAMLDEELVLDPAFFRAYGRRNPRISRVELRVKAGRDDNEMTRYRFDVVLHVGPPESEPAARHAQWPDGAPLTALDGLLDGVGEALWICGVPDARTVGPVAAWSALRERSDDRLADARARMSAGGGFEAEDLIERARARGFDCRVEPALDGRPDRVDLALSPTGAPLPWRFGPDRLDPWSAMANEPLFAILAAGLQVDLRRFAERHLSKAMVPDDIVVLDALPETATGKIDYGALPETERRRPETGVPFVAPRTAIERTIAAVWAELLELDRVGIDDAVMNLGANSLMLVEASGRLEAALGRPVSVVELFEHPTVRRLAAGLEPAEAPRTQPAPAPGGQAGDAVAIVGMALRFPGADDLDTFWRNLLDGVESIEQFERAGARVRAGGVVSDVDRFDAALFGLSPREAASMDPQQRLFLECAWAALEDASLDPHAVDGRLAVFAGSGMSTYFVNNVLPGLDLDGPSTLLETAHQMRLMMGHAPDFVATRVSYLLGGTGPSMTVQTGCSTALVATHLAMRSLREGESDLAIVGATSIRLPQDAGHVAEEGAVFSPDGRCRPFDAQASGTVFSNGVAAVVLAPLQRALDRGDPIYAVIRGSAVNNDGPARAGFAAPGVDGQARVVRAALRDAGVAPDTLDYVEAHGTGTRLGDPIEVEALTRAHADGAERDAPCWLGSVKGNIGHLGVAAGMAGLIKCALALHREALPPTVHFTRPNPLIPWQQTPFRVLAEARPWPRGKRVRRAGLSAFGMGGTNAHLVLEEAPRVERPAPPAESHLLTLGARTPALLIRAARELADWSARHPDAQVDAIARTARASRRGGTARAFVVARTPEALRAGLRDLAREAPREPVGEAPRVGFLFTGQGSQYIGMGRRLYAIEPTFRAALDRCAAILEPLLADGLLELMHPVDADRARAEALLTRTANAQPALFSIGWALSETWRAWGVEPAAVMGHSLGAYVAACAAGCVALEDVLPLVALRGRLMQRLPAGGAMASVEADRVAVECHIGGLRVEIGAVNSPENVVISGDEPDVEAACARLASEGIPTRRLAVSHAFHSARVEPMLDAFAAAAGGIAWTASRLPLVSDTDGSIVGPEALGAAGWRRHTRAPVDFARGLATMRRLGIDTFVELGPHPVLCALGRRNPEVADCRWLPSLRRKTDDEATLRAALGALYVAGAELDWQAVEGAGAGRSGRVHLPPRPLDRQRHWFEPAPASSARGAPRLHPFVDACVRSEGGGLRYDGYFDAARARWLLDHVVAGAPIVPGTAVLDLALAVGRHAGCAAVDELVLEAPIPLTAERPAPLRVELGAVDADGGRSLTLSVEGVDGWTTCARGRLKRDASRSRPLLPAPPADARPLELAPLYARIERAGVHYGPAFRGLRAARRGDRTLHLEVERPPDLALAGFGLHPALLDAALHGLAADERGDALLMPFAWRDVRLFAVEADSLRVELHRDGDRVRLRASDGMGAAVIEVGELLVRRVDQASRRGALSRVAFEAVAPASVAADAARSADWVVLGEPGVVPELADLRHAPDLAAVREAAAGGAPVDILIVPVVDSGPPAVAETTRRLAEMATLLASWLHGSAVGTRLVVLDHTPSDAGRPSVAAAAVRGLVRSARGEAPDRPLGLLTLEGTNDRDAVLGAIAAGLPEARLSGGRLHRATWAPLDAHLELPHAEAWRLSVTPGDLGSMTLRAVDAPRRPLVDGEVRLRVRAAGLNFRDVLGALGLYPGGLDALGSEGAGRVTEVGPGVRHLAVGDRVMGLFDGAFGPVAIAPAAQLCPMPSGWRFAEAASVPAAFLTAWYALVVVGRLRAGERVLIHAAAGGVGMAAVQIARHVGAEVFGTASPGKWPALRDMGLDAEHVASSRDLAFADRFPPMQVVLNSLAGDFVDASLGLLARGGRFLEIGKRDRRPAADAPGSIEYRPVDLADAGAERLSRMWRSLLELFAADALTRLPTRVFDIRRAPDALRFMQRARHRGKLVLSLPRPLDPAETVVVTGATGGLGRHVVEHLVDRHGVRHLLLLSRRGPDTPGVDRWLAGLAARGVHAELKACDVADAAAVRAALTGTSPTIGAVFHLAGVLADAPLTRATRADFERAAAAKLGGALALHAVTRPLDLSAFVLFSSAAGALGTTGQGAYAAANAALDALAERWSAAGHPATALAWAGWDTDGMLAGLDDVQRARLERLGARPLGSKAALALLDRALTRPEPVMLAGDLRRSAHPDAPQLLRREDAVPQPATDAPHTMLERVRAAATQVLGLPAPPRPDAALTGLGLDSLLSIDLRNALARALGRSIPMSVILGHDTPAALAQALEPGDPAPDTGTAVTLRAGRDQPTLLLLPGIQGDLLALHDLVRALPESARAYGLGPPDLQGRRPCPRTIREIAAAHAESVLRLGPLGPVRVVGHSFGGKVGFELARRLLAAGLDVRELLVLDGPLWISDRERPAATWTRAEAEAQLAPLLARAAGLDGARGPADVASALRALDRQVDDADLILSRFAANMAAAAGYGPTEATADGLLDLPVRLIRAEQRDPADDFLPDAAASADDPTWGWRRVTPHPVAVEFAPGDHFTLLTGDRARTLADALCAPMTAGTSPGDGGSR